MKKNLNVPIISTEVKEASRKTAVLEGFELLRVMKITTTYEKITETDSITGKVKKTYKQVIDEKSEPLKSIPLTEVTPEMVNLYRKKNFPSFVFKAEGKLFYAAITNDINFLSSPFLGSHKCAISGRECSRLSAASDEEGGCAKVRNFSKDIEKYPWITRGYETFNTSHDVFVVLDCSNYKRCPPQKTRTVSEINDAKLGLAQYVWDDVNTIAEVNMRKRRNKGY